MTDEFTSKLLAALNDAGEVKESDWRSIEAVLRQPLEQAGPQAVVEPVDPVDPVEAAGPLEGPAPVHAAGVRLPVAPQTAENRFAAMVSSGMAKIRTESS